MPARGIDRMISLMGPTAWTATCKSRTASSLKDVRFIQYWSGRIGMTRDLLPTVLREPASPWVYRVLGCVGLPWATFCGDFAARQALAQAETGGERYFGYFDVNRRFWSRSGWRRSWGRGSLSL